MTIGRIPSVEGGIQPTIVDAKGDLIAATAADTVNRLAVGSNDQVLVADSSTSTGLAWKSVATPYAAGKNKIINGDFGIWQRGTSFSNPTTGTYTADRWRCYNATTSATITVSQQTFTPGTAPVSGYEGQYFFRVARTVTGSGSFIFNQRIEDVRTFAGQTVTFSFWAKSNSAFSLALNTYQYFGAGGSSDVLANSSTVSITTSWTRHSITFSMPSISGKTVTTGTFIQTDFDMGAAGVTFDVWGVQMESGSVATPFQTATGTLQGELAACQRYFLALGGVAYGTYGIGQATSTSAMVATVNFGTTMRIAPSFSVGGNTGVTTAAGAISALSTLGLDVATVNGATLNGTTSTANLTQGQATRLFANNDTTMRLNFSAEL